MKRFKRPGVMNIVLVIIGCILIIFTTAMIQVYILTGGIPDTLVVSVFTAATGECGVMGWIKTTKERKKEREYELEDRQYQEDIERKDQNGFIRNNQRTENMELPEE